MNLGPPTTRQLEVLEAIDDFTVEHGHSPTIRELAQRLGVVINAVVCHLDRLRERGLVTWEPKRARTLRTVALRESIPILGSVGKDGRINWRA